MEGYKDMKQCTFEIEPVQKVKRMKFMIMVRTSA
jgi:hypothetical protein